MADQIRLNSEQMEYISAQLTKLSSALAALQSQIRSIRIDRQSGSEVAISRSVSRLSCTDRTLNGSTILEYLSSAANCLGATEDYSISLRQNVIEALNIFLTCEKELVHDFYSLPLPDVLLESVAQALGYTSDPSMWSAEMHKNVYEIIQKTEVIRDGDFICILTDEHQMLVGPSGLIADRTTKQSLSGTKITNRVYDGNRRITVDEKTGLINGIKYKEKLIKPKDD